MAMITEKSVVLLLVIGFLQVQARATEFVFGPREHLDSGQKPSYRILTSSTSGSHKPGYLTRVARDEEEDESSSEEDGSFSWEDDRSYHKEDNGEELESDEEISDYLNSEKNSEESEDYINNKGDGREAKIVNQTHDAPLKRVRRRIIPVGGAAIDRSRGGRGQSGRSRSPWSGPPDRSRQREAIIRRSGPTGSADLFSLYPELAPPGWPSKRKGGQQKKKKNKRDKPQVTTKAPPKTSRPTNHEEKPQSDERAQASDGTAVSPSKKSSRLTREDKEDIARFAELHGIDRTLLHFRSRVDVPLRSKMVEKFLRRYQTRMQRRANRS